MPHRRVTRVEVPALKHASRGVRVLEVPLHDDVPARNNLADCLTIPWDVDKLTRGSLW
jgi:hypothetical protein